MASKLSTIISILLLLCSQLLAQDRYIIVATKGSSGLFAKPAGSGLKVGDVFIAKRSVNGQEIEVARVKIALLDNKYCGVKIEEAVSGGRLKKGDYLVPLQGGFNETLSFLDQISTASNSPSNNVDQETSNSFQAPPLQLESDNITGFNSAQSDSQNALDDILALDIPTTNTAEQATQLSAGRNGNRLGSSRVGPTASPRNTTDSFLGLSLAALAPVSGTSDLYAAGPKLGLQVITNLGFNTNLRFSGQYAFLQPSSSIKASLDKLGQTQSSSLTMLTVSIQPRIINNFILDLGFGYYRQHDEVETGSRISTSTKNAVGTLTGLGYHWRIRRNASLMILGSGNFYFLQNGNATYLSLLAGYFFTI
ncbi:MAG: hypothetical protein ACE5I1_05745 [bacterium]